MSRSLRSARSRLRLLRYRPAQPPLTRCYQQRAPAPLLPAASQQTHLAHGLLQKLWKVVAATYSTTVSLLTATHEETVPYTNRVHRVVLSPSDEKKYGHIILDSIKEKHGDYILGSSDRDTVRVRRIANAIIRGIHRVLLTNGHGRNGQTKAAAARLPQTQHLRNLKWKVFVVRDEYENSICAGKIVISTGMLNLLNTDAEIATILAHKIGHVVARHCLEFNLLTSLHIPFLSKLLPFSRRMETEADHIGIMLLATAGFDPLVAPEVWLKLGETGGDPSWDDYIASHPSPKTRSQLLSEDKVMLKALEFYHRRVCAREGTK